MDREEEKYKYRHRFIVFGEMGIVEDQKNGKQYEFAGRNIAPALVKIIHDLEEELKAWEKNYKLLTVEDKITIEKALDDLNNVLGSKGE